MSTLLLATSGPSAEVGLIAPGEAAPAVAPLIAGRTRGRDVLPAVHGLLEAAGAQVTDLQAIAVDVGPGSFTGVRVGVTTAKTLAWSLELPLVGVQSLDVLAAGAGAREVVVALRDAGRGRAYAARYEGGRRIADPARMDPADVHALCRDAVAIGEGVAALVERLALQTPALEVRAGAAALWAVAAPLLAAGCTTPPHALVPCYLQASAPERLRDGEVPGGP